jgi:ABC-type branched-subunit amino acid transport system permease subunit
MIADILSWNIESIVLAAAIAAVSGVLFAMTHECTKWLIAQWRSRKG